MSAPDVALSPIALIRGIQSGDVQAQTLPPEPRRACVEQLLAQGYGTGEMSEILKVTPRTIQRDLEAIREANALQRDPSFAGKVAGETWRHAELAIAKLTRLSNDPACPHAERIEAIRAAWEIRRQSVETLQSLEYLPTASRHVLADVTHHEGPSAREIEAQLVQIQSVLEQTGQADAALGQRVLDAKRQLALVELGEEVAGIRDAAASSATEEEGDHE